MKNKLLLLAAFCMALTFNSCNQEDEVINNQENEQEEILRIDEEVLNFNVDDPSTLVDPEAQLALSLYGNLQKSTDALARSMEMALEALPANVNAIEITPAGSINPNGETRTVIATGTFTTSMLVKAQNLATGEDMATGAITGNGMMGFTTLTLPAHNAAYSTAPKVIGFFFQGSTGQWELFHFETQSPNGNGTVTPPLVFSLAVAQSGTIHYTGGIISTVLTGNFTTNSTDRLYIRAYSPTTGQQVSTSLNYFQGTTENFKNLTIRENTLSYALTVVFQYSLDNGITWIAYHTTTQQAKTTPPVTTLPHVELPNGCLVALYDATNAKGLYCMNWPDAMGLAQSCLSLLWNEPGKKGQNSGCNGYYERADKKDKGLWKVPGSATAQMMVDAYKQGKFTEKRVSISTSDRYWTSVNGCLTAGSFKINQNGYGMYCKTSKSRVRCYIEKSVFTSLK